MAGCQAMIHRFALCRPGFSVQYDYVASDWEVIFANGARANSLDIAEYILDPYSEAWSEGISNSPHRAETCSVEGQSEKLEQ